MNSSTIVLFFRRHKPRIICHVADLAIHGWLCGHRDRRGETRLGRSAASWLQRCVRRTDVLTRAHMARSLAKRSPAARLSLASEGIWKGPRRMLRRGESDRGSTQPAKV